MWLSFPLSQEDEHSQAMPRVIKRSRRLTHDTIAPGEILAAVNDAGAGAVALFLGTVRDNSDAGKVDAIVYEAYEPMAEKRLAEIDAEVKRLWPVKNVAIVHRVGMLRVGDVSVAVAVSAVHRAEAFEACRHAMERIKHDVPIWKKERVANGKEVWVEGERIGSRATSDQGTIMTGGIPDSHRHV